jgi:hypothetical protein
MHRSFNEASASVKMLECLIASRETAQAPCDDLRVLLREAEARREAARADLQAAGVRNVLARE